MSVSQLSRFVSCRKGVIIFETVFRFQLKCSLLVGWPKGFLINLVMTPDKVLCRRFLFPLGLDRAENTIVGLCFTENLTNRNVFVT